MLPSMFGGEMSDSRPNVDKVREKLYEITGMTNVNFMFTANDGYGDSFNMQLMDRANMPMIMTAGGTINGNSAVLDAAAQGAFWDLTPFLETGDYPYLSQVDESIKALLTVNGQYIGIPKLRDPGRHGFSYRADWAEKLGFGEPQSVEDVYNMLYAFTHNDPDGNGKDDTYGMEACGQYTGWMDIIQTWFGCGNGWVEQDGNLIPVHETPEYKEALDWMRKLHAEGIIRPDFASVQSSDWGQAVQRSEAGSIADCLDSAGRRAWLYFEGDGKTPSVVNPDEYASMVLLGPVAGHTARMQTYNGYFLITKDGAKTEDDVRGCLQFLDRMCSVEGRTLADWGIEGLTFNYDADGYASMLEGLETASYPFQGLNQAEGYIPFTLEGTPQAKQDLPHEACTEAMKRSGAVAVGNPAEAYLTQSQTNATMGTVLAQTISDARTQYIAEVITWDQFQAAVATWESQGGAAVKEEVNAAYHAAQG